MVLQDSNIKFKLDNVDYEVHVIHNLNKMGLSIQAAFDNWVARTKTFTSEDFCEYIVSKDPVNILAFTKEEYDKYTK